MVDASTNPSGRAYHGSVVVVVLLSTLVHTVLRLDRAWAHGASENVNWLSWPTPRRTAGPRARNRIDARRPPSTTSSPYVVAAVSQRVVAAAALRWSTRAARTIKGLALRSQLGEVLLPT